MKNITRIPLSLLALACLPANAVPTTTTPPPAVSASGTGYTTFISNSYIDLGDAMEPMEAANRIMCIVNASGAPLLPNATYQALADFNLCGVGDNSTDTVYSSMTVESSRENSSVAQEAKIWINSMYSIPGAQIHLKAQMSQAPSATNHWGVWQLDWEVQNPAGANTIDNGHMKSTEDASGLPTLIMASKSAQPGQDAFNLFANISITSEAAGMARVDSNGTDYSLAFNNTHVSINDGTTTSCQDLNTFTDEVHSYNLYNSAGALVDIESEIHFTTLNGNRGILGGYSYWDSTNNVEVTNYWVWIDGDDYPTADGATIVSDSETAATKYTITWDVEGTGASATQEVIAVADGESAAGTAHTFDRPIIFDTSSASAISATISPATDRDDDTVDISTTHLLNQLSYNGAGRLWGIEWDQSNSNHVIGFADGTALTSSSSTTNDAAHRGKIYYVKADTVAKIPAPVPASDCSALAGTLATAASLTLPTATNISNNPPAMGTEPVVTAEPIVIDGLLVN